MSGATIKPGAKSDKQAATEQRLAVSAELPPSLRSTFSDVFKLVDEKQYRRAIKAADVVLKKVPGYGPAMSMKALAIFNLGPARREEAFELAKGGLKADLKCVVFNVAGDPLIALARFYCLPSFPSMNHSLQVIRLLACIWLSSQGRQQSRRGSQVLPKCATLPA